MTTYTGINELCNSILSTNKYIQWVAILNKQGRAVERCSRSKYANEFSNHVEEMLFMQCVLQVSMGRDFDDQCGPINYYISERSNLIMLTFPLDEHVILATASKNVSTISLARKISSLISDHKMKPISDNVLTS